MERKYNLTGLKLRGSNTYCPGAGSKRNLLSPGRTAKAIQNLRISRNGTKVFNPGTTSSVLEEGREGGREEAVTAHRWNTESSYYYLRYIYLPLHCEDLSSTTCMHS